MSGIAGIFHFSPTDADTTVRQVETMLVAIDPQLASDSSHAVAFGPGALAHATFGSSVNQPRVAISGDVAVAVDGFIFGDGDGSSADRAVAAYRKHGSAFLRHLRGMFAVILIDISQGRVIFGTDWIGQRPLFYRIHDNCIAIASEARALVRPSGPPADANLDAVVDFLTMGMPFGEETFFHHVTAVAGGTMVEARPGKAKVTQYWRIDYGDADEKRDPDESAAELAETMMRAVAECVGAAPVVDVPLSGGLDSRLIVASLHALSIPMRAYTIGGEGADDVAIARRIARTLDVPLEEIPIVPEHVPRWLTEGVGLTDGMFAGFDAHILNVAHRLPSSAAMVLDGNSCLDGFYPRFRIPATFLRAHYYPRTRIVQRICVAPLFDRKGVLDDRGWFRPEFRRAARHRLAETLAWLRSELFPGYDSGLDVLDHLHYTHRARRYNACGGRLLSNYAESLSPILHPLVLDLAQRLPASQRGEDKPIVARAIARLAPSIAEIPYERTGLPPLAGLHRIGAHYAGKAVRRLARKVSRRRSASARGVAVDYLDMLRTSSPLREFVADILLSKSSRERGIFAPGRLERVIDGLARGEPVPIAHLGRALAVELFHRQHFDRPESQRPAAPPPAVIETIAH